MDTSIILKAMQTAIMAHGRQTRADGKTPYILHPVRVARIVEDAFMGIEEEEEKKTSLIVAALLHDVLEDSGKKGSTKFTSEDLAKDFGHHVAGIVQELTQDSNLPKEERRAQMIEHCKSMSWHAKFIKLSDRIDNMRDMSSMGQDFKTRYVNEAKQMLENMKGTSDTLEAILEGLVKKYSEPV